MISARDLSIAIYGVLRFAMLDRSAVQYFDNSEEAFWKSFSAALIAAPGYLLLILIGLAEYPVEAGELRILAVETISYVIGWVLFPLVMVSFTETANCSRDYFRFISAWNWSAVIQVYFFLAVTAFAASGSVGESLAAMISLSATLATLAYQGFIAQTILKTGLGITALIVAIDVTLGIGVNLASRLFY